MLHHLKFCLFIIILIFFPYLKYWKHVHCTNFTFSAFAISLIVSHSLDAWLTSVLLSTHWIKCIWQHDRLNFTSAISIWPQLNIWWSSSLRIQMDLVSSIVNFKINYLVTLSATICIFREMVCSWDNLDFDAIEMSIWCC
jgi:hypothetical protein